MAHLSSVRLRGFKTFARSTEFVLEPGVTVVIGPNGSGKSNLADAVLWVLGEQSPTTLRGHSMQDVIFNGPDGKASAVAEVTLTLDNGSGALPLDYEEVEITRRLVRDGTSEYRLNGVACRLMDVQDLLGALGLGREMHSVIGQGRVEALLNSTPEVRRALVEEAAGLGRFKKRRERARSKLERTRQNLLRVTDVEREVKSGLRPLRQQAAAAERFAQAMEKWALARARLSLFDLAEIQKAQEGVDDSLGRLQERKAEIEEGLAALREQRMLEEEQFAVAMTAREELGAAYHRARAEAEHLESRAVALRQRVARNEGEIERGRRRRELAESEFASHEARLREVEREGTDRGRLEWVEQMSQRLSAEHEAASPAYRAALDEEDGLKDKVFELEVARSRAVKDRDFLGRELEEKGRLERELSGLAATAAARVGELEEETERGSAEVAALEQAASRANEALEEAARARDRARGEEEQARREEVHIAESLAGLESRRKVLAALLEKRAGVPEGALQMVRDRADARLLTEVIDVEPGYERALAAALGPVIQAVILEGRAGPDAALQGSGPREVVWPSESGAGGASAAAPALLPTGARDLWEVVRGPEDVLLTLRALVPPTAVVADADVGGLLEAGKGRAGWRYVTQKGELVTPGLHAARRTEAGAEAMLRARSESAEVEAELSDLVSRQETAREAARSAASRARDSEQRHHTLEDESRHAERRLLSAKNEADLRARRVEEALSQAEEYAERLERERGRTEQMQAELAVAEEAIASRGVETEEVRVALRALQTRLEDLRRNVIHLEEKRAQAALLEVRLRERCRAQEGEVERVRAQKEEAASERLRMERRLRAALEYAPVLTRFLEVVERLSEKAGRIWRTLDDRAAEARVDSEEAARTVRDRGGAEARLQHGLDQVLSDLARYQVDSARLGDRRTLIEEELRELRRRHLSPREVDTSALVDADRQLLERELSRAEERRDGIGPVNPLAERECAEMEERLHFLSDQRKDLEASISRLQEAITELDEHIDSTFHTVFSQVKENFSSVIATIFPGAKGYLTLTEGGGPVQSLDLGEGDDDASEAEMKPAPVPGISLSVKLPHKAARGINLLSGGEKAMTAIAFLFSIFLAQPCPFYILDEVEASLDDVNIRRFLSLIREYRDRAQFIIITHQRQTMEIADTLYGVGIERDGTSRLLSRRLDSKNGGGRGSRSGEHTESIVKEA